MIKEVFDILINNHLTPYLNTKVTGPSADGDWVLPCNISEIDNATDDIPKGKIIMSLVNIEEDRVYKVNDTRIYSNNPVKPAYQKPPVYLNLYVLFASNFSSANSGDNYLDGLNLISFVIQFFQHQNVFTPENSPAMADAGIEELIFDLRTLSFQDLNNLWGVLGAKYLPSVLYKVRLLTITEDFAQGTVPFVKKISIDDAKTLSGQ